MPTPSRLPFTVAERTHWLALCDRQRTHLRFVGAFTVTVPLLASSGRIYRYAEVAVDLRPHAVATFVRFTPSPNR